VDDGIREVQETGAGVALLLAEEASEEDLAVAVVSAAEEAEVSGAEELPEGGEKPVNGNSNQ